MCGRLWSNVGARIFWKVHIYIYNNANAARFALRRFARCYQVAGLKPEMKENIVRLLKTTPGKVNVKARTHEGVDSTGELRAVECHVVLTLVRG